jgi:glycosyltransferase involved in cell wall biosynthesis
MIYIGIPVHNEQHTMGPLLWRIRELLSGRARDFCVIVCDDASDDGTSEALASYARILPLGVLTNERRLGYAASLERLVRESVDRSSYPRRDALVTLQADFTDAPEAIAEMVKRFEGGADLVTAGKDEALPRGRRVARLGARVLAARLSVPEDGADPYGSLRLYRLFTLGRALADLASPDAQLLSHEGWAANTELLLRVWPHVRRAERIPIDSTFGRRYRPSRFHAFREIRGLMRAARDPALRSATSSRAAEAE